MDKDYKVCRHSWHTHLYDRPNLKGECVEFCCAVPGDMVLWLNMMTHAWISANVWQGRISILKLLALHSIVWLRSMVISIYWMGMKQKEISGQFHSEGSFACIQDVRCSRESVVEIWLQWCPFLFFGTGRVSSLLRINRMVGKSLHARSFDRPWSVFISLITSFPGLFQLDFIWLLL